MSQDLNWFAEFNKTAEFEFLKRRPIAYFCAEFALSDTIAIFAGGLGVLAGDTVREAADRNIPFVALGLSLLFIYDLNFFWIAFFPSNRSSVHRVLVLAIPSSDYGFMVFLVHYSVTRNLIWIAKLPCARRGPRTHHARGCCHAPLVNVPIDTRHASKVTLQPARPCILARDYG